jgi:hypothetical protein
MPSVWRCPTCHCVSKLNITTATKAVHVNGTSTDGLQRAKQYSALDQADQDVEEDTETNDGHGVLGNVAAPDGPIRRLNGFPLLRIQIV